PDIGLGQDGLTEQGDRDGEGEQSRAEGEHEQRTLHVRLQVKGWRTSSFTTASPATRQTSKARTRGSIPDPVGRVGSTTWDAASATKEALGRLEAEPVSGRTPGVTLMIRRSIRSRWYSATTVASFWRSGSASARSLTRMTCGCDTWSRCSILR